MASKMPKQKPGKSRQDYETPQSFIDAVEGRFGTIDFDLAANASNTKSPSYYSEAVNGLVQDWTLLGGNLWLNPPFADIAPWAKKCAERRFDQRWTLLLVPASIGTDWWRDHVLGKGWADGIPRLTFKGMPPNPRTGKVDPYPKDLALVAYGFGVWGQGFWDWRVRHSVGR